MADQKFSHFSIKAMLKVLPRRRFLLAMTAFAAAGLGLWRSFVPEPASEPADLERSALTGGARPAPGSAIFSDDSTPLLFAVADAIVPRSGVHPSASEIDLLPRLDRCLVSSPEGADPYRLHWPRFEHEIRQRVSYRDGRPDPEALHDVLAGWHRDYASQRDPTLAASYFEALRRNVLLAYYTSPAGWASVGYAGPAHRPMHRMDEPLV